MSSALLQDQLDAFARLQADATFAAVPVLLQRKGVTESDIEIALGTLNAKSGLAGALAVVLMPTLEPDSPDAPGPRYRVVLSVQVIEQPLINLGDSGTGQTAEQLAERVRQLLHHASFGRGGSWAFSGMDPLEQGEGKISYAVKFSRLAGDASGDRLVPPGLALAAGIVTATHADAVAALWYTLDGSYPWPGNSTATLYTAPVALSAPTTLRAAAYRTGYQASSISAITLS